MFKAIKKTTAIFIAVIALLLVAGVGTSYYFYNQYQQAASQLNKDTDQQVASLIKEIEKSVELPQNEVPTIATVSDKEKLKDQVFFAKAQNGDKVLIYKDSKKAILYRPSTKKIIEFGPVNIAAGENSVLDAKDTASQAAQLASPVNLALYNGTSTAGLTINAEKALKAKNDQLQVVYRADAANDYEKTIVVNLANKDTKTVASIASLVGGEVGSLPEGEIKPESGDILVILGTSYKAE